MPGETYLPDEIAGSRFYEPTDQGLEKAIRERLERLRGGAPHAAPEQAPPAEREPEAPKR